MTGTGTGRSGLGAAGASAVGGAAVLRASTAGGAAVVLTATALAGVLTGSGWFGDVLVTVGAVVAGGVVLRALRAPRPLVLLGQLMVLAGLLTALCTEQGVLGVVPGPAAVAELEGLLRGAAEQIRVGVAPVAVSAQLRSLIVLAVGLAAVLVDTLAVAADAPATAGLVLLGMLAVPVVLADRLLPWWTFVAAALGFALLLSAGVRSPPGPGRDGAGRLLPATAATGFAVAVALAVLAGATLTWVGTEPRLTGPLAGVHADTVGGVRLDPFTSLRGRLVRDEPVPLLRVRGLEPGTYLRAVTLSRFDSDEGFSATALQPATRARGRVPPPAGPAPVAGQPAAVRIEPINYADRWLPTVGVPRGFAGTGPGWSYDPAALTAFTEQPRRAAPYTVRAVLPAADRSERAGGATRVGGANPAMRARYLDTDGADPRVRRLAERVTSGTSSALGAAVRLTRFFTDAGNGFRYSLTTPAGGSDAALVDFLLRTRTGYCEQYASALAVMLRSLDIPARVAVGFTSGTRAGDARTITTTDAHAWVQAWIPGTGWLRFDPTPLSNGRGAAASYVAAAGPQPETGPAPSPAPSQRSSPPSSTPSAPQNPPAPAAAPGGPDGPGGSGAASGSWLPVAAIAAAVVLAVLTPRALRGTQRRARLRRVDAGGAAAAPAAWDEVLAAAADRGTVVSATRTARAAAEQLTTAFGFDRQTRRRLGVLVRAVERSWYAPGGGAHTQLTQLRSAVTAVGSAMDRHTSRPVRAWLLPRSVLPRRTGPGGR